MNVLVKSANGIYQVSAEAKLLSERKVFLEGIITEESACEFAKKIMILNHENMNKSIDVLFYTPGGEIMAGMFMYDIIQSSKAPIRMFCMKAYSMGAILFSSGNHGRYMLPHGEIMLHEPIFENSIGGNSSSIKSISDSLLDTKHKLNMILSKHTGKSEAEIDKACSFDHYFNPEESIEFGLADGIMDFSAVLEV